MESIVSLFQAFGISAPAGLNAYLTLLVVGIMARWTNLMKLNSPFDILTNDWVLLALAVLVFVELFVDKIPGVDTVNDIIGTIIRPVSGAILFAASNNVISDIHPVLALMTGLVVAGGVHAVKATVRPAVTVGTGGTGNAVVSVIEDVSVLVVTILAIVLPVLGMIILLFLVTLAFWWLMRRRKRHGPALGTR